MSEEQVLPELDTFHYLKADEDLWQMYERHLRCRERQLSTALASLAQSEAERERLQGAIDWALGASGEFRERGASEGAYWWRTELRSRALLADRAEPAPVVTEGNR